MFTVKRIPVYLTILLVCGLLFMKFMQPTSLSANIDNENNLTRQIQSVKVSSALETWIEKYSFSEYAPPNQNRGYFITIYSENNNFFAKINIDGFQTMDRLLTKVSGNANSIKLEFVKYLPDNMSESYNEGDILIRFEKRDSKLITNWGKIQPLLLKNNRVGEYFKID